MTISIGSLADFVASLDAAKTYEAIAAATVEVEHVDSRIPGSSILRGTANNAKVLEQWAATQMAAIDPYRSPSLLGPSRMIDGRWQAEIISYSLGD